MSAPNAKFEYRRISVEAELDQLPALGEEAWELVSIYDGWAYLKRKLLRVGKDWHVIA